MFSFFYNSGSNCILSFVWSGYTIKKQIDPINSGFNIIDQHCGAFTNINEY